MSAVTIALIILAVVFVLVFAGASALKKISRQTVLATMVVVSGVAGVVSLWLAYKFRTDWLAYKVPWGYLLLAIWIGAPPVWFLTEYSFWPPAGKSEDERTQHMHDLSRNIWLALVAILAITMDLKLKFPGSD